jgi:hypothetical protein
MCFEVFCLLVFVKPSCAEPDVVFELTICSCLGASFLGTNYYHDTPCHADEPGHRVRDQGYLRFFVCLFHFYTLPTVFQSYRRVVS